MTRTTTVGTERISNPTFGHLDAAPEVFRAGALADLGRVPAYYAHMAGMNRRGPRVLGRLILPPALDPAAFEQSAASGVAIVDARDRAAFAAGHIRGSLNIELGASAFSGYVGWLVPFAAPLLLVLPDGADALVEATTELLRVGYEWIPGYLAGGVEGWAASGRPLAAYGTTDMEALHRARAAGADRSLLLDVRQPIEWQTEGIVPGSATIFVADLAQRLAELPKGGPITVFCRTGHRASMAASILDGAGFDVELVSQGGAADWPEPLERGSADTPATPAEPARP